MRRNYQSHDHSHHTLVLDICHQTKTKTAKIVSMFKKTFLKSFIVSSLAAMSARGFSALKKSREMHGVQRQWRLRRTQRPRRERAAACHCGAGSLRHLCAANVTCSNGKAYTGRFVKISQRKGKRRARQCRLAHAYVIKSFLLSLHWGYLGLGLGMVTSPGYLLSSRASWKGSKSSGCRRNTASGPHR